MRHLNLPSEIRAVDDIARMISAGNESYCASQSQVHANANLAIIQKCHLGCGMFCPSTPGVEGAEAEQKERADKSLQITFHGYALRWVHRLERYGKMREMSKLKRGLFRLQVLVFPFEASRSGLGDEPGFSSPVPHFPMLRLVIEFEVAGPGYLKPSQFM